MPQRYLAFAPWREQGKAYVGGTPSVLSGLPPFASPAAYHCTNTTPLGGSTAAAAITLDPRLRL